MQTLRSFEILVDRDELMAKLRENKSAHIENYELAMDGYAQEIEERALALVHSIEINGALRVDLSPIKNLSRPTSNAKVYEQVIEMLEWSQDEKITLSSEQFRAWVKDDWDWLESWRRANSVYVSKALGTALISPHL